VCEREAPVVVGGVVDVANGSKRQARFFVREGVFSPQQLSRLSLSLSLFTLQTHRRLG
jgi:hypothetical protein